MYNIYVIYYLKARAKNLNFTEYRKLRQLDRDIKRMERENKLLFKEDMPSQKSDSKLKTIFKTLTLK